MRAHRQHREVHITGPTVSIVGSTLHDPPPALRNLPCVLTASTVGSPMLGGRPQELYCTMGSNLHGPLPALWGLHCMACLQHRGVHFVWSTASTAGSPYAWWKAARIVPWGPLCVAHCQHCGVYVAWPAYSTMGSTVCKWPTASTVGSTLHGLPAVFKHLQKCSLFFYYVGGWKND